MLHTEHRGRRQAITSLGSIAALALCAFQFGDRKELNKMPFTEVQPLVSDPARVRRLAKQGNIDLLIGQRVPGKTVSLREIAYHVAHSGDFFDHLEQNVAAASLRLTEEEFEELSGVPELVGSRRQIALENWRVEA
jgi:hypothetical protein